MNILDKLPKNKQIILFDGVCNFCDQTVQKIIKADTNDVFVFASLQSPIGQEIVQYIGVKPSTDSVILYQPGIAYYIESDAAIKIAKQLKGVYSLIQIAEIFPKALRNAAYRYFAKSRYKWFGKKENCPIPSQEIRSKFLV